MLLFKKNVCSWSGIAYRNIKVQIYILPGGGGGVVHKSVNTFTGPFELAECVK